MSEARINRISNEKGDGGPSISGITTFSGLNYFVPPKGTTAERPSDCPPGSIRFNTDSAHLEYFDGLQWLEFEATNDELGVNGALGNRGVFSGGQTPTYLNTIEYVTISTLGNVIDFGDSTNVGGVIHQSSGQCASRSRGIFSGGYIVTPSNANRNVIEFITFSSTGNATDFGDLTVNTNSGASCSSSTRGLFGGGYNAPTGARDVISYVTIASAGNAVSFGTLTGSRNNLTALSSSTRGCFCMGSGSNVIDYVTIASTGNAQDFGDSSVSGSNPMGSSNSTRGVIAGGGTPAEVNTIQFITIASTGNTQDFGDLTSGRGAGGTASSPTRGVFGGGRTPTFVNIIDYITITTTGDALDFGDLSGVRSAVAGCSNGHGGL